jgi:hypothetical protein
VPLTPAIIFPEARDEHNCELFSSVKLHQIKSRSSVSVQGYEDGIALTREAANPKPLIFELDDPWFASNLILELGALA